MSRPPSLYVDPSSDPIINEQTAKMLSVPEDAPDQDETILLKSEASPLLYYNTKGEYILLDKDKAQSAGLFSCTFNLVNNIIGGGVLALPFAMKSSGLIIGVFLIVALGLLSGLSALILVETSKLSDKKSYRGLAQTAFGVYGGLFIDVSAILFLFGALVGYMVIIGDVLVPFTDFLGDLSRREFVVAIVAVVLILPLSLLNRVDYLKFTSMAALVCILYLVAVVVFRSGEKLWKKGAKHSLDELEYGNFTLDIFKSIPIISFAFTFHPSIFPIFGEMVNATMKRMSGVISLSIVFCMVAYLLVGIFGYLTFLDKTDGNIFTNYNDDFLIEAGKILLALIICFSYPLIHYPARLHFDNILLTTIKEHRLPSQRWRWIAITLLFFCLSYVLSILLPDISVIFSLFGATAGNVIIFIAPAAMYIKLSPRRYVSYQKVTCMFIIAIAFISAVIGVYVVIADDLVPMLS